MIEQEKISELAKAMALAFPKIKRAVFDKTNPHFKSKYASLGSVVEAIVPALSEHGLFFIQTTHNTPGFVTIETMIFHTSGQNMSCGVISLPVGKNDAQGYGSATTYAKRYALSTAFGVVADEDDDGNEACEKESKNTPQTSKPSVKKLSEFEITNLASSLVRMFNGEVNEDDVIAYLFHWQSRAAVPSIDEITLRKDAFVSSMKNWIEKQKTA